MIKNLSLFQKEHLETIFIYQLIFKKNNEYTLKSKDFSTVKDMMKISLFINQRLSKEPTKNDKDLNDLFNKALQKLKFKKQHRFKLLFNKSVTVRYNIDKLKNDTTITDFKNTFKAIIKEYDKLKEEL